LVSLRQKHQSYPNYWEFPGGKVENGETLQKALTREFSEEVGIDVTSWQPLIQIPWEYEHDSVLINIFVADKFKGDAVGKEGQKVKWISLDKLAGYKFPEANRGIVQALSLPSSYAISGSFENKEEGLTILKRTLEAGIKLVQLRAKNLSEEEFIDFAKPAIDLCHAFGAKVLLNAKPRLLNKLTKADGLQLASNEIMALTERPISNNKILSVSTHNQEEISKSLDLNADIVLISPVNKTSSHPDLEGIGWDKFSDLVAKIPVPVYALGGMTDKDITNAQLNGGQGVAAISSFWKK